MSLEKSIALWRKEAKEALRAAILTCNDGIYWLTLFHCHLAAEKALKAQYLEDTEKSPPPTHALLEIANELSRTWEEGDITLFEILTTFAVESRYHDEKWLEEKTNKKNAEHWIKSTQSLLNALIP